MSIERDIRSDARDPAERFREEQGVLDGLAEGTHPNAAALRQLGGDSIQVRVLRPERPYAVMTEARFPSGGAARKVDQYAARKVIQSEGGSFYVLLLGRKEESACGNVGISRSVRDFQAPVEIVL
jgi:hypothetical protein